jgi:transmembrane sensor
VAGDRSITAVGTAFVVQKRPDQVIVTVTEGSVEVAPGPLDEAAQPLVVRAIRVITPKLVSRVTRGEQIAYGDADSASIVEHVDPQAATGWTEGQLEFDHVPLWSAVQVLNRYSPRTITVDQFSGNQIVTGLVLQNQIEDWVRSLPGVYPVDVTQSSNTVCVRARERDSNHASNCGDTN